MFKLARKKCFEVICRSQQQAWKKGGARPCCFYGNGKHPASAARLPAKRVGPPGGSAGPEAASRPVPSALRLASPHLASRIPPELSFGTALRQAAAPGCAPLLGSAAATCQGNCAPFAHRESGSSRMNVENQDVLLEVEDDDEEEDEEDGEIGK